MALKANEQAIVNLVINGEQAKTSLREVTGAVNALTAELSRAKEANDPAAIASAREEWQKMKEVQTQMKAELFGTKTEAESLFSTMKQGFGLLATGFSTGAIIEFGKQLEQLEVKASGIQNAFAKIGADDGYIEQLRKSSRGLINDLDLEKIAVKANNANIPIEKMGTFLKFATTRARETGESVTDLATTLIEGLGKGTTRALAGLGINVSEVKTEFKRTGDMVEAVANIINKQMGNASQDVTNFGDKVITSETKWENFKEKLASGLSSTLFPELANPEEIAKATELQSKKFGNIQKMSQKQLQDAMDMQRTIIGYYKEDADKATAALDQINKGSVAKRFLNDFNGVNDKIRYAAKTTAEAYQGAQNALAALMKEQEKRGDAKSDGSVDAIDQQMTALKQLQGQLAATSAEWKKYQSQIDALQKKREAITGKADTGSKKGETDQEAAKKKFADLLEQLKQFDADALAESMRHNDKEVQDLKNRYDKEIQLQRDFLTTKGITKPQKDATNKNIADLEVKKSKAVADLLARQEKDLDDKIAAFKESLTDRLKTEYEKQAELINKFYNDQRTAAGANADQLADIEMNRQKDLNTAKLNEQKSFQQELLRIEKETQDAQGAGKDGTMAEKMAAIRLESAAEIKALREKYDDGVITEQQLQEAIFDIVDAGQTKIDSLEREHTAKRSEAEKQAAQTVSDTIFTMNSRSTQLESSLKLSQLEGQKNAELANKNMTETQRQAITASFAKQEAAIKLQAWKADQRAAVEQAIINGALAMTKVAAQTGILSFTFDPLIAIETAAKIALIASQPAPQFGDGGIIDGPSHAAGGVPLLNGNTGRPVASVEGGETLAVFSKNTTANNGALISQLLFNSMHRNGARVNAGRVNQGIQQGRSAYASAQQAAPNTAAASAQPGSGRLDRIEQAIEAHSQLIAQHNQLFAAQAKINSKPVVLSRRVEEQEDARVVALRDAATF